MKRRDSTLPPMLWNHLSSWIHPIRHSSGAQLVYADLNIHQNAENEALLWLDPMEVKRWKQYQAERSKREFSLCRAALRQLLCQHLKCNNAQLCFATEQHGKPYAAVDGKRVSTQFSVSHSDSHGLIMINDHARVGIDVETLKAQRDYDGIAKMIFSPDEYTEILSLTGQRKIDLFYRIWTFKEALVKAVGSGLSKSLTKVEIPPPFRHGRQKGMIEFPESSGKKWILENLSTKQYAAASALEVV